MLKKRSLEEWVHIGSIAQSIVVIFGVFFAYHELSDRLSTAEREKIQTTIVLLESLEKKGFIANLDNLSSYISAFDIPEHNHSLEYLSPFILSAYKDIDRISFCLDKELCDPDAVKVLLCPHVHELSFEEAIYWDHSEEVKTSLDELDQKKDQLNEHHQEIVNKYLKYFSDLEQRAMQLPQTVLGKLCNVDY